MKQYQRTMALMLAASLVAVVAAAGSHPGDPSRLDLSNLRSPDGSIVSGGLSQLVESDDTYLRARARETGQVHQPHLLRMRVRANSALQNPSALSITIVGRITDVEAQTTVRLRDWVNGGWTQVDRYGMGMVEAEHETFIPHPENYIRGDGRIRLEIEQIVFFPFTLGGFHSLFDEVSITALQ